MEHIVSSHKEPGNNRYDNNGNTQWRGDMNERKKRGKKRWKKLKQRKNEEKVGGDG